MVGRELNLVVVGLAGVDFQEGVVRVAQGGNVKAVGVQVGRFGQVVDDGDVEQVSGVGHQSGAHVLTVVGPGVADRGVANHGRADFLGERGRQYAVDAVDHRRRGEGVPGRSYAPLQGLKRGAELFSTHRVASGG